MTSETDTAAQGPMAPQATAPAALPRIRLFYWSVRRELWEHRVVYVAPLAVAAVALVGFVLGAYHLPRIVGATNTLATASLPPDVRAASEFAANLASKSLAIPYHFIAFALFFTGLLAAVFYCQGALHGERRDRSILFWKSLPVSDLITVASKMAVPMLVTPVVVLAAVVGAHLIMLAVSTVVVAASGQSPSALWAHLPILRTWGMILQGLPVITLWYAPLYAWLILVSAWAKRAPFLWAVAAPLALALVEKLALGTGAVWSWLGLRMIGPFQAAYLQGQHEGVHIASPVDWDQPHMWIGLVLAAAFLAAAVWLRRSSEPI